MTYAPSVAGPKARDSGWIGLMRVAWSGEDRVALRPLTYAVRRPEIMLNTNRASAMTISA